MADLVVYVMLSLLLSVFVIGIPGNLTIVRVYMSHKRKTSTDVLLISLALSDCVFCLTLPLHIISLLKPCEGGTNLSCKVGTAVNLITIYYSILLTGAIALDRYYAVCKPLTRTITPKRALVIAMFCFVISVFVGGTLGYDSTIVEEFAPIGANATHETVTVCRKCAVANGISERKNYLGLLMGAFYAAVIFVFVAVAILYTFVYKSVRQQAKVRAAMGLQPVGSRSINEQNTSSNTNSVSVEADMSTQGSSVADGDHAASGGQPGEARQQRKINSSQIIQQKITRMLILMTILIWGTWTPLVILVFFNRSDPEYVSRMSTGGQALVKFLNFLYLINYGVNIIVYLALNDRFRQETIQLFRNKCRRSRKVHT